MPKLDNTRHELFCQYVARGNSLAKAYEMAGYKLTASNPSQLFRRPSIKARIAELVDQWADKDLGIDRTLKELARLAFSDIRKVVQWTGAVVDPITIKADDGTETTEWIMRREALVTVTDSKAIDASIAAAISEVSQDKGGAVRVRLHPKFPALSKLVDYFQGLDPADLAKAVQQAKQEEPQKLDFKRLNAEFSLPVKIEGEKEVEGARRDPL